MGPGKKPEDRITGLPDKEKSAIRLGTAGMPWPDGNPLVRAEPAVARQSTMVKWAVWFTVGGDLRFLSHRNMMSLCERSAARAKLPIKFSEGFNPRPKLSLPLPRPVGVSSQCELMIIELKTDSPVSDPGLHLGEQFPEGMKLIKTEPLPNKTKTKIKAVTYELLLTDSEQKQIEARLEALKQSAKWEVARRRNPGDEKSFGAAHDKPNKLIDIKRQVGSIGISSSGGNDKKLSFTLAPEPPAGPIGPERVLRLLEVADVNETLARLEKTAIECEF